MNLSAVEAEKFLRENKDTMIIDVRTLPEFAEGHIKDAILLDMTDSDFQDKIKELSRDDKYFIYCRSGSRSSYVIDMMKQLGFKEIYHLEYGLIEWQSEKFRIER